MILSQVDCLHDGGTRPFRMVPCDRFPGTVPGGFVDTELHHTVAVLVPPFIAVGIRLVLLVPDHSVDDPAVCQDKVHFIPDFPEGGSSGDHVPVPDLSKAVGIIMLPGVYPETVLAA